jgi:hypothetical protein
MKHKKIRYAKQQYSKINIDMLNKSIGVESNEPLEYVYEMLLILEKHFFKNNKLNSKPSAVG